MEEMPLSLNTEKLKSSLCNRVLVNGNQTTTYISLSSWVRDYFYSLADLVDLLVCHFFELKIPHSAPYPNILKCPQRSTAIVVADCWRNTCMQMSATKRGGPHIRHCVTPCPRKESKEAVRAGADNSLWTGILWSVHNDSLVQPCAFTTEDDEWDDPESKQLK